MPGPPSPEGGPDALWQAVGVLPSRRQLLTGAAAALLGAPLSACEIRRAPRRPAARPTPTASDRLLSSAAARERALLAAYDDVLARYPDLAPRLGPYRADHAAHLHAVEPGAVVSASVAPSTRRTSKKTQAKVRARLREKEEAAAAAYARQVESAPAEHAALLAVLAACEASHAELL